MTEEKIILIDGKEYPLTELNETARMQIANLQVVDAQIAHLQQQLAIAQTARATYASVLQVELTKTASV